jgi:glycosyltransferase involved in cell wall biosynthesis
MRLLILDQFSDLGGAQQCLLDLLPGIAERGWSALVGMPGHGPMFERVRSAGFEAVRIGWAPWRVRDLAGGADLVYVNGPRLLPLAALAGFRRPVVFHSHSYLAGAKRKVAGLALRRLNARMIANCRFVAESWREYVPDVPVIYNGIAGPDRPIPPRRDGPVTIGCIGRIAPEKGQREFVEVARIVHRVHRDWRFVIYGAPLFSGAAYEREVRAAAAGLPVEFAGWASDVYDALAGIDVLLVPSASHEATTRVILEAFAAGVPVIAFPSGGIPEIIEHGVTGLLAGSVEEMAISVTGYTTSKFLGISRLCSLSPKYGVERYRAEVLNSLTA